MKNKIAIGLGLMLGITASISFADGTIQLSGPSDPITKGHSVKIQLDSLTPNTYYDLTCTLNNIYEEKDVRMFDHLHSHGTPHNMGPVLLNDNRITPVRNHIEAIVGDDMNTIIFQQLVVEKEVKGATLQIKAKNDSKTTNPYGILGFSIEECHAVPAQSVASDGASSASSEGYVSSF
jgi:hypothetical protein